MRNLNEIAKFVDPDSSMTLNEAGGLAYKLNAKEALAQLAATGCLSQTFYATEVDQLKTILDLTSSKDVDDEFLAKLALYARVKGFMKDMPAILCAVLASRKSSLLDKVFPVVIDNGKMLRNFVMAVRSGVTGRKSFGSAVRRLIRSWFDARTEQQIFNTSIGNNPSMADVVKMIHPTPKTPEREAMYGYLIGKPYDESKLPKAVVEYIHLLKNGVDENAVVPDVPFQYLTSLELTSNQWKTIAQNASWQTTRMNLNTFLRHDVFEDAEIVSKVAARIRNEEEIRRAKAFPYQLMTAYMNASEEVPSDIRLALQDAMEIATDNVPVIDGLVALCVDVSGSMDSSVTGYRCGATSKVKCVDVAGLMASCILRQNPNSVVIPFDSDAHRFALNPRDSVITNAQKLAELCGGGTDCSSAMKYIVENNINPDVVIYISDNESWIDTDSNRSWNDCTQTVAYWDELRKVKPNARLINIDIQPYASTQTLNRTDIANVGGFSDVVFDFVAQFAQGHSSRHWVEQIEQINLNEQAK
ncbi:MAG: RNA-binding protein [Thermoguttaceae bacterium]|nr:RNA-binding protein [Thermoguttaceae bacterium]